MSLYEEAESKLANLDKAIEQTDSARERLTGTADRLAVQIRELLLAVEKIEQAGSKITDSQATLEQLQERVQKTVLEAVRSIEERQRAISDELQGVMLSETQSLKDQLGVVEERIYEKQSMLFSQHKDAISAQNEKILQTIIATAESATENGERVRRRLNIIGGLALLIFFGVMGAVYITLTGLDVNQLMALLGL